MTAGDRDRAAAVRAVAAGGTSPDVDIVRAARRGEDRLLLLSAERSWWVSRLVAGESRVVAYIGDFEADRDFELFLRSPSPRGSWVEDELEPSATESAA